VILDVLFFNLDLAHDMMDRCGHCLAYGEQAELELVEAGQREQ
jgi:hypothetical protein